MRSRLIELLKADIESYDLQPFTTAHLSRINQKERELLELLEEKNRPMILLDEANKLDEAKPLQAPLLTLLDKEAVRLYLGGDISEKIPTERLVADASLLKREIRIRDGKETGEQAFPTNTVGDLEYLLMKYIKEIRWRLKFSGASPSEREASIRLLES